MPATTGTMAHNSAPAALNTIKRGRLTPMAPASGGATVAKPGTYFATSNDGAPQRSKIVSV